MFGKAKCTARREGDGLGQDSLDCTWIKEILVKRASKNSSVAYAVTSDPKRALQLKAYLATCGDYLDSYIYLFSPWKGLQQLNRANKTHLYFQPVSRQGGGYEELAGVRNRLIDLQEALRFMDTALREQRCVLVLEHLDGPREEEKERHLIYALRDWAHDTEIINMGSLIVAVVGSVSKVLDELTRKQAIFQQPPIAAAQERGRIIDDIARELNIDVGDTRAMLVLDTAGMDLHRLETSLREAHSRTGSLSLEFLKEQKNYFIRESGILEVAEPAPNGFADVGGYQAIKDFVIRNIVGVLKEREHARTLLLPLPRGFILFGPPGTGKSVFARALAGEISIPIVNLRTERLYSKYLGESGHNFRAAIDLIEQMSPAIVFIDEIDKLLRRRGGESTDGASIEVRNVENDVLEWLGSKGRMSILVGATNRPEDLDRAAIRQGRIDYMIPMLYPDVEARRQIIEVHLGLRNNQNKVPLAVSQAESCEIISDLAAGTEDFSGAQLEHLVNEAKRHAFHNKAEALTRGDFKAALESFQIDHAERQAEKEKYLRLSSKFASDARFFSDYQKRQ